MTEDEYTPEQRAAVEALHDQVLATMVTLGYAEEDQVLVEWVLIGALTGHSGPASRGYVNLGSNGSTWHGTYGLLGYGLRSLVDDLAD